MTFTSFKGYPSHYPSSMPPLPPHHPSVPYSEISIFCQPPLLSAQFIFYRLELLSDETAHNRESVADFKLTQDVSPASLLTKEGRCVLRLLVCVQEDDAGGFALCWQRQCRDLKWEMWCKHVMMLCLEETLTQNILKGVLASICCLLALVHFYVCMFWVE